MNPADILPTIAPEFAGIDATDMIALAELRIAPNLCGDQRPLLVAYLAAHMLTMAARNGSGGAGAVTSLKEGQLAIGYASTGTIGALGSTSYGSEYDQMSRACVFAARTRVDCL